eukprot:618831-Amphidinium_carterae.1
MGIENRVLGKALSRFLCCVAKKGETYCAEIQQVDLDVLCRSPDGEWLTYSRKDAPNGSSLVLMCVSTCEMTIVSVDADVRL